MLGGNAECVDIRAWSMNTEAIRAESKNFSTSGARGRFRETMCNGSTINKFLYKCIDTSKHYFTGSQWYASVNTYRSLASSDDSNTLFARKAASSAFVISTSFSVGPLSEIGGVTPKYLVGVLITAAEERRVAVVGCRARAVLFSAESVRATRKNAPPPRDALVCCGMDGRVGSRACVV